MNSFTPFDKFERACAPDSKSLHETMQESCKTNLKPDPQPCNMPGCVPYWQQTDKTICMSVGLIGIEEVDGCGHTRINRTTQRVTWSSTEETRCNEPLNRIEIKQINQCGEERWITTNKLCCTPFWVNDPNAVANCDDVTVRRAQIDGCGNTRIYNSGEAVAWISTGDTRCEPGDIYQVEQVNQCGATRWVELPGGCPCIPNWQPTGTQRCSGIYIDEYQADGCGNHRWVQTVMQVNWTDTGNTRCVDNLVQNEQVNQCGSTRWVTTDTPCSNAPEPNEIPTAWNGALLSGANGTTISMRLEAISGLLIHAYNQNFSNAWVTGTFNRADYEVRLTVNTGSGAKEIEISGSDEGVWFNLGDVANVIKTMKIVGPAGQRDNIIVRFDIRKVGGPITGGQTFGPFTLRAT